MLPRLSLEASIPHLTIFGALLIGIALARPDRGAMADAPSQTPTALALDVQINGNSAASVGLIDSCTSVAMDATFPVDVIVRRVTNLVAWEVYLQYDRNRLEVVGVDVGNNSEDPLFLSVASNSNVINVSDPVPNHNGLYRLAAADIGIPAAPEQGSGVLARLTLKAKAAGAAALGLPHLDYNKDGTYDLGPRLITLQGKEIGDGDGDGFLDSLGNSGHVAIGSSCADVPQSTPGPGGADGTQPTGAPGETPIEASPTGSGGSNQTPGADETPDAEATPRDGEDTSVAELRDQPDRPSGGDRGQTGEGGLVKLWMLGPAAVLGLLGLLFAFFTVRRSGLGL